MPILVGYNWHLFASETEFIQILCNRIRHKFLKEKQKYLHYLKEIYNNNPLMKTSWAAKPVQRGRGTGSRDRVPSLRKKLGRSVS